MAAYVRVYDYGTSGLTALRSGSAHNLTLVAEYKTAFTLNFPKICRFPWRPWPKKNL